MATRNITITYPDGAAARVLAALKTHYGQITVPGATPQDPVTYRDRTNAEAFAAFEASVKDSLRHIVRTAEKQAAVTAAEAGVTDVGVS